MANLPESSSFDAGVYQIETTDPVVGGLNGVTNTPLKNLANRTRWLKDTIDAILNGSSVPAGIATLNSPTFTGDPKAPTPANGDNDTSLATTAFVNYALSGVLSKSVAGGVNVTLTATEAGAGILILTGAITANIAVVVPTSYRDRWIFRNDTTGSFTVTVRGATGNGVVLPRGFAVEVFHDGTNCVRVDGDTITRDSATGAAAIPAGTTAQRPATPTVGYTRYNTDLISAEVWNGTAWGSLGGGATGSGTDKIFNLNGQTVTANYSIPSGQNAMTAGSISINDGVTVTIPDGSTWTVV